MTFEEYSAQAITTDVFGGRANGLMDPAFLAKILGLVGESGEVAEKFKKIIRDKGGQLSDDDRQEIAKELSDVLWYINALSHYMGISLETVAQKNLSKVLSRKERGVTKGSGDNR